MEFEWDEEKRLRNIEKHQIDLARMRLLFDGRPISSIPGNRFDEERWLTIGILDDVFFSVVWTQRGAVTRIISARRSRDAEKRHYRKVHSRGNR